MPKTSDIVMADRSQPLDPMLPGVRSFENNSLSEALRGHWRLVLFLSLLLAGGSASTIWFVVHPEYVVSARLHIAPVTPPILHSDVNVDISRNYSTYVATQRGTMLSQGLIGEVLETAAVRSFPPLEGAGDMVSNVLSRLQIRRIGGTELLRIAMAGQQPETMAAIVNSLAATYLREYDEEKRKQDELVLSSLREEQASLEAKRRAKGEEMLQFIESGNGLGSGFQEGTAGRTVSTYQQLLTAARTQRAVALGKLEAIQTAMKNNDLTTIDLGEYEAYVANDPQLNTLKNELRAVEMEKYEDEALGRGLAHPKVRTRPRRVAALRKRMEARQQEVRRDYLPREVAKLESNIREAEIEEKVHAQELEKAMAEQRGYAREAYRLENVRQERDHLERTLAQIRNKIWTVQVEQKRIPRITLRSSAVVPSAPNNDKRPRYIVVASIMSVFVAACVGLLVQRADTKFHTPSQVVQRLGVRVLGSVQQVDRVGDRSLLLERAIQEPVRGISTALLAHSNTRKGHSRLITSPTPGSGKSSMAVNLARSLAATGRRVLLIDGDNHRQGVTHKLDMQGKEGLTEFLMHNGSLPSVVYKVCSAMFECIPAGRRDEYFGELLMNHTAQERLKELCSTYDEVIVDSPPLLASSHALILATMVDEVVLVLRAGKSNQEEAETAQEYLASVGCRTVGAILNGVDPKTTRYGYGYGYDYAGHYQDHLA